MLRAIKILVVALLLSVGSQVAADQLPIPDDYIGRGPMGLSDTCANSQSKSRECAERGGTCKNDKCVIEEGGVNKSCNQQQCSDSNQGLCIPNPLTECSIQDLLSHIIDWLIVFAILLSTGMVVWAGILYTTAGGSAERAKKAQRTLIYTLIGLAIVIVSKSVALVIQNFFTK